MIKRIEIPIICILFITCAVGYSIMQFKDFFTFMTPIFLLATGIYITLRGLEIGFKSCLYLIATLLATFAIESAGVSTGRIFGDYSYGASLGIKFMNVPPIIALNWLVLILSSLSVSKAIASNRFLSSVISGVMLVFLDILIEPVAMKYDWWNWSVSELCRLVHDCIYIFYDTLGCSQ